MAAGRGHTAGAARPQSEVDTYRTAGRLSMTLDPRPPTCCSVKYLRRFTQVPKTFC